MVKLTDEQGCSHGLETVDIRNTTKERGMNDQHRYDVLEGGIRVAQWLTESQLSIWCADNLRAVTNIIQIGRFTSEVLVVPR